MKTIYFSIFCLLLSFVSHSAYGQEDDRITRLKVLKQAIIDSNFVFGKWTKEDGTETHIRYLGKVTTTRGETLKVMNYIFFWGLSHRATSRILIFDAKNRYLGNYYLTVTTDLPTMMRNGKLIFKNTADDCDKNLQTTVDLNHGLPKTFFRNCFANTGDICTFSGE